MLDTISLYQAGRDFNLNHECFKKSCNEKNEITSLYNTFYNDEGKQAIFIENNLHLNYLRMQFSLPKLLYGNSIENVKQDHTEKIEGILHQRLDGIFEDDFMNMQVSRLDISQNINVANDTPVYVHSLHDSYQKQGRYKEEKYSDESIIIKNNSRRFMFYDKIKESLSNKEITNSESKAYGNILRFEIQHKKAIHIRTSFNKKYTFDEILSNSFFEQAKLFQLNSFDKLFCNRGNYEMFVSDASLMDIIFSYNRRNTLKNFLIRSMSESENFYHDFQKYEDLLKLSGMKRNGIRKALQELRNLLSLSRIKSSDMLEEIRLKLVA